MQILLHLSLRLILMLSMTMLIELYLRDFEDQRLFSHNLKEGFEFSSIVFNHRRRVMLMNLRQLIDLRVLE